MAERLRRETRNLMGSPAQVQILLLTRTFCWLGIFFWLVQRPLIAQSWNNLFGNPLFAWISCEQLDDLHTMTDDSK